MWDAEIGQEMLILKGHSVNSIDFPRVDSVSFSPDGRLIVSSSGDGTLKVWNVEKGSHLWNQAQQLIKRYPEKPAPTEGDLQP